MPGAPRKRLDAIINKTMSVLLATTSIPDCHLCFH